MLSELEGVIARRVLLNFRADRAVVGALVPAPFEPIEINGYALVGICMIRFAELRPAGWPRMLGWSPRSMAHRAAVRFADSRGDAEGVYIFRRDTSDRVVARAGGRLFPGIQYKAAFEALESGHRIELAVRTKRAVADAAFHAVRARSWTAQSKLFESLDDATAFLSRGECGYSPSTRNGCLDGMRLRISEWHAAPLAVENLRASFFENGRRFPPGSIEFDHALLMENVPHRWSRVGSPASRTAPAQVEAAAVGARRNRPFVRFFDA